MRNGEIREKKIVDMASNLGNLIEEYSDTFLYNEMLELVVIAIMKPLSIKELDKGMVLRLAVDRAMKEE